MKIVRFVKKLYVDFKSAGKLNKDETKSLLIHLATLVVAIISTHLVGSFVKLITPQKYIPNGPDGQEIDTFILGMIVLVVSLFLVVAGFAVYDFYLKCKKTWNEV